MIVITKPEAKEEEIRELISALKNDGFEIHYSAGKYQSIIGVVGDTIKISAEKISANHIVEKIIRVQEPYKLANRLFHPDSSQILINSTKGETRKIGPDTLSIIAGPCSVESKEQVVTIANSIKNAGAGFLRGGAFKPRTSPYSFQGLGCEGIEILLEAKKETGLPIVTELMAIQHLELFEDIDIIQIGARNMQNFTLLKELGYCKKPILLKRGSSATVTELLMAAEYIMAGGNSNIILCERGIRTFTDYTRNTLDLSAVPLLKKKSHLPVIVDPSHGTGISWLVPSMAKAAVAAGADGLIIEVHNDPEKALCDGEQSLTPQDFSKLMQELINLAKLEGRKI